MTDLSVTCDCGAFRATARDVSPATINHIHCFCRDCQAMAYFVGKEAELLDADGGSDLVQMKASALTIDQGTDKMAIVQLRPGWLFRWYTTCCKSHIANTISSPRFDSASLPRRVFHGIAPATVDMAIGPVIARAFLKSARRPVGRGGRHENLPKMVGVMLSVLFGGLLARRLPRSPFFNAATGAPITPPAVIDPARREAIYDAVDAARKA